MNACKLVLRKVTGHEHCVKFLSTYVLPLGKCYSCKRNVHSICDTDLRRPLTAAKCTIFINTWRSFHVTNERSSGSNKWSKIKQVKVGKDTERAKVIYSHMQKIRLAIRESSITDPKNNSILKKLIEDARAKSVPMSTIESGIAAAMKSKETTTLYYLEGKGLGGLYYIIEVATDKLIKTKLEIQQITKRHKGTLGDPGTAVHAFEKKGILDAAVPSTTTSMDEFVEIAIEAGAEDVAMEEEDESGGDKYLRFVCEPDDLYSVKKALEGKSLDLTSCSVEYIPNSVVTLSDADMSTLDKMMDKLNSHNDVLRVFVNVDAPEL